MTKKYAASMVVLLILFFVGLSAESGGRPYRCPAEPEDDAAAKKLAGELFNRGEQLTERKKYHRALKKFLCSAEIRDHINTTFNIAQAARTFKNKKKLIKYFKFFIETKPETVTALELEKLVVYIEENEL